MQQIKDNNNRYHTMQIRYFIPNLMTIFAVCAGVTAIRLAFEGRFEKAVLFILIAALMDGLDGRIARMLDGSSPFGAQMDSLADAVNFGVAPALVIYSYVLNKIPHLGWIAALIYCIACCLRLARFNIMLEDKNMADWKKNYFVGVPAPAGALLILLPLYLGALGMPIDKVTAAYFSIYTVIIAFLLVSTLPVWNGKKINHNIFKRIAIPLFLFLVAYVGLLMAYIWETLAVTAIFYIIFLPISSLAYYKNVKKYGNGSEN